MDDGLSGNGRRVSSRIVSDIVKCDRVKTTHFKFDVHVLVLLLNDKWQKMHLNYCSVKFA